MFDLNIQKSTKKTPFADVDLWDFLIVGGGPAGLNAALYAKRKGLNVGLMTKDIGGQLHNTTWVDNYAGFKNIEGKDLSDKLYDHVTSLDVPMLQNVRIQNVIHDGLNYHVHLDDGRVFKAKTLLYAAGGRPRYLEIPGESAFANRGVSYCTTCDAPFFKDQHVIVAGGGNSAAEAVLDLVPWAKKITVIHRSQWRADQILLDKLDKLDKLEVHLNTQLLEVLGEQKMTGVRALNKTTMEEITVAADGLFIEIGNEPNSDLIKDLVELNERHEVLVNDQQETSMPGLFAAGDVTNQPYKQIIISVAEGAKAALAANHYLNHTYKERN